MAGKVLLAIFSIFLLLGVFRQPIIDGIKGIRADTITGESHVVTTAAGVTSANVTLSRDLYLASTSQVSSISSNITESPAATSYTEATNVLLVSSLSAGASHLLTFAYSAETTDTTWLAIGPFASFLIFGGLLGLIAWGVWKGRRR